MITFVFDTVLKSEVKSWWNQTLDCFDFIQEYADAGYIWLPNANSDICWMDTVLQKLTLAQTNDALQLTFSNNIKIEDFTQFWQELTTQSLHVQLSIGQSHPRIFNAVFTFFVSNEAPEKGLLIGVSGLVPSLTGLDEPNIALHEDWHHPENKQKLLRTIIDNIPINIYIKDVASRKILANKAEYLYAGFTNEVDLLGKDDYELYDAESAAFSFSEDQEIFSGLLSFLQKEALSKQKDGTQRWFLATKLPLKNDAQQVIGLLGMSLDITERKKAELLIAYNHELLTKFSVQLPGALYLYQLFPDGSYKIPFISTAIENMLSLKPEAIYEDANVLFNLVHPDYQETIQVAIMKSVENLSPWQLDFTCQHPQRGVIWVRGKSNPELQPDNSIIWYGFLEEITAAMEAKLDLEKTKEFLQQTNRIARIGGWEVDLINNTNLWTEITKEIHEVPEDFIPVVEKGIEFYKAGENRDKLLRLLQKVQEDGVDFDDEFEIITYTGRELWVRVMGKAEMVEGKCVRLYGTFQDIDESKRNRIQQFESETKFRSFVENANDFVISLDGHGCFLYASPSWVAKMGFQLQDVIGKHFRHFLHPDHFEMCNNWLIQMRENNQKITGAKYQVKNGTGEYQWHYSNGAPIFADDGTFVSFILIAHDISALVETETALAKAKHISEETAKHYKYLLDNQSVYIVKTDLQANYVYANEFYFKTFNYDESIIGANSMQSIAVEDHEKCIATVIQCLNEPGVPHSVILRKPWVDNTFKYSQWEFIGTVNEQGEIKEILCMGYDVTQLMEALQRSEMLLEVSSEQNVQLRNFTYIVSHNIRSHSANLTALVQFLEQTDNEEEKATYLEMLKVSTAQLEQTILNLNEILTVQENIAKPKKSVLLKTEVNKALQVLNGLILEVNATVHLHIPDTMEVSIVPSYLDSILLNLLSNAIKYRSRDRALVIDILAGTKADKWWLTIKDNGIGLDLKRYGQKIFGMYKTFHNNEDARGFGLYLTKNQVEAMKGTIEVNSKPNEGSEFTVTL